MKALAILLTAALLLAGCATQPKEQLAAARAAGCSSALIRKLERWGSLSPEDIIELKTRRVNDAIALRQLDRAGVDYVVDKAVVRKLEAARVSRDVIVAAVNASQRFVRMYTEPGVTLYHYGWGDPYGYPYPHPRHRENPPPPPPGAPGTPFGPLPPPHP